ncbi:MAG: carboxylating nicotinate-nucleotide diphosphorylase, partial [candidate division Zixibacteria bacterium]|nr:carboxylating nicotinate-nucleotide diphosphorylase [candidate division Zixibacteria bacterium]
MKRLDPSVLNLVRSALDEDIGRGDVTSLAALEPDLVKGVIVAKSEGVLSGLAPAIFSFQKVDSANKLTPLLNDGDRFRPGDTIIELEGLNQTLLTAERTALNFLAHLSGVATLTRRYVDEVSGTDCRILDTRKTTPGFRHLEKAAVQHGGGENHRFGLYDMVLIKDNHIAAAGSISAAVDRTRDWLASADYRLQFNQPGENIEIEVEIKSAEELTEAIKAGVKRLLLDNQSLDSLRELVRLARRLNPDVKLEASG